MTSNAAANLSNACPSVTSEIRTCMNQSERVLAADHWLEQSQITILLRINERVHGLWNAMVETLLRAPVIPPALWA
eukprot:5923025-Pyramimonas_sp.AAC.1